MYLHRYTFAFSLHLSRCRLQRDISKEEGAYLGSGKLPKRLPQIKKFITENKYGGFDVKFLWHTYVAKIQHDMVKSNNIIWLLSSGPSVC